MKNLALLLTAAAALAIVAAPVRADTIGVTTVATSNVGTGSSSCTDPNYPSCTVTQTISGLTLATASEAQTLTTSPAANPPNTTSSASASISGSEGYFAMSLSASSQGLGDTEGQDTGTFNDVLTATGPALDFFLTFEVTLTVDASFQSSGYAGGTINACFDLVDQAVPNMCITDQEIDGDAPVLQPTSQVVQEQLTVQNGGTLAIEGTALGQAYAQCGDAPSCSSGETYTSSASGFAYYTITPITPDITITDESGCSLTSGYGCDSPPSATPEPATWLLLASGLLAGGWWLRRRAWTPAGSERT